MSKTDNEELDKKIRFALNVLTPENYEKVKMEIKSIAVKRFKLINYLTITLP